MDVSLTDVAKLVAALLAIVIAAFKQFLDTAAGKRKLLSDRHEGIKEFLTTYKAAAHPIEVESAFAAATGYTKITAVEIPLLLRQSKPTQFIAFYARLQDYLQPDERSERFELRSWAAKPLLRTCLVKGGLAVYASMAMLACFYGFFVLPRAFESGEWRQAVLALSYAILFAGSGLAVLIASSHLHWAEKLYAAQVEPKLVDPVSTKPG